MNLNKFTLQKISWKESGESRSLHILWKKEIKAFSLKEQRQRKFKNVKIYTTARMLQREVDGFV